MTKTTNDELKKDELKKEEAVAPGTPPASSSDGDRYAADEGIDAEVPEEPADESPCDRRYRQQLRQVERERDVLREALVPHLRAAVEKVAADRLASPQSIWLIPNLDPLQLVDDNLAVDHNKVKKVVATLVEHAPQLAQKVPDFDAGPRGSGNTGASWQKVIGGRS